MKASDRFRKAAAVVLRRNVAGCCAAISEICPITLRSAGQCTCKSDQYKFSSLFKPNANGAYWFGEPGENKNERSLALCFMAAIAESEGD